MYHGSPIFGAKNIQKIMRGKSKEIQCRLPSRLRSPPSSPARSLWSLAHRYAASPPHRLAHVDIPKIKSKRIPSSQRKEISHIQNMWTNIFIVGSCWRVLPSVLVDHGTSTAFNIWQLTHLYLRRSSCCRQSLDLDDERISLSGQGAVLTAGCKYEN